MAHQKDEEETFGERLERILRDHGISQAQLARVSGQTDSQISELIAGSHTRLTITPVLKILKGLIILHAITTRDEAEDLLFLFFTEKEKPFKHLEELGQDGKELLILLEKPKYGKPLIGRDEAVAEVCELLKQPEIHLLTLTGAPGIGKTSLAENVVDALNDNSVFDDGVNFVQLETISEKDGEAMVSTIAREFRLEDTKVPSQLDRLKTYLHEKHLLLVLDTCQHLIQECAEFAKTLLQSCPRLKLLITSTELLGIEKEKFYRVMPLQFPDSSYLPPIERLREYSAIELFETRRRNIKPEFAVTDDNKSAVVQICARLDGHPLAIKLAAGFRILSEQRIAARLDDCLPILVGGIRTDAERHQTMKRTIKLAYDLLPKHEKVLLQRLSVFRGGWLLDMATEFCKGDGLEQDTIPGMVNHLVIASLVEAEDEEIGFCRLLEVIRQYAHKKLERAGNAKKEHDRHLVFFLMCVIRDPERGPIPEEEELHYVWASMYENIRAALEWCLERKYYDTLLMLGANLWKFWEKKGLWTEGRYWLKEAINRTDETEPTLDYFDALWGAASLAMLQGDSKQASLLYEKSLAAVRELGADFEYLAKRVQAVLSKDTLANISLAFEDPMSIYSEWFEKLPSSDVFFMKGEIALAEINCAKARTLFKQALKQYEKQRNKEGSANCFLKLGSIDLAERDYGAALACFKNSLSVYQDLTDTQGIAESLARMGITMLYLGNYREGAASLKEGLEIFFQLGDTPDIYYCLESLSHPDFTEVHQGQTTTLFAFTVAHIDKELERGQTNVDHLRKSLGEQAFNEFWSREKEFWYKGYTMTLQEAIAYAYSILNSYIELEDDLQV